MDSIELKLAKLHICKTEIKHASVELSRPFKRIFLHT